MAVFKIENFWKFVRTVFEKKFIIICGIPIDIFYCCINTCRQTIIYVQQT